jgi:PAS domain S-box-containing protein
VSTSASDRPGEPPPAAAVDLEFLLNANPSLIAYIDARECYQFNNRAYEAWFGRSSEEMRGRHLLDVLGVAAYDAIKPHVQAALRGGRIDFETIARYEDGGAREIHATYVPDIGVDGRVRGFVAIVQDISHQAHAARQVRAADERLTLAADAAQLGVWSIDGTTGEIELSDRAATILGLQPGHHPRNVLREMLHPDDHAVNRPQVERAIRERSDFDVQYRVTRADGEQRWLSGRGRAAYQDDGRIASIIGVVQDITPAKELEAALRRQSDENARLFEAAQKSREIAETANRLKDDFLATVSHELRTPLNAIMGWARLLGLGTLDTNQQARAIETIERNAVVQQRIIEDILDVSRIVTGKIRLEVSSIDLLPAVQAAIDSVGPSAASRGVTMNAQLDPAIGRVLGDSSRLQQIVWNLVSNAIKFTPRGGAVSVLLRRDGPSAELVVADTGRGIPLEFLPHVFDRFRQGDASTTRAHGGLGLGLAIVRHLTELHGGTVQASSDGDGCGATFTIRLPLDDVRDETERTGTGQSESGEPVDRARQLTGVRVLVIDDEPDARELFRVVLSQSGADVRTASSARSALMMLDEWLPEVIVCDIAMPIVDGYAFVAQLRSRPRDAGGEIPAAALTAYARLEDRDRALAAGYHVHIVKPVDPGELTRAVVALARQNTRAGL